jgi:hypothetical protein
MEWLSETPRALVLRPFSEAEMKLTARRCRCGAFFATVEDGADRYKWTICSAVLTGTSDLISFVHVPEDSPFALELA